MFLRVVILVFAATYCTARVIDVRDLQNPWEQSGKFEGDIVLTDEELRNRLINPADRWPYETDPFVTDDVSNVTELQNAWERSGKFEGDIMLTELQQRNGIINTARRWPDKTVPIAIDNVFNALERHRIQLAIDDFHIKTSIRFRQYNPQTDRDFVNITGFNDGCWSYVGRIGGHQRLNLQPNGCIWHGIIIHELLHALGFYHQHSVPDRDDYVIIFWGNITQGMEHNFNVLPASLVTSFGVPYDYGSIMHYSAYAFSRNGERTIQPRDPNAEIGQRWGFSARDIEKLELMYTTTDNSSYITSDNSSYTTPDNSSDTTTDNLTYTTTDNLTYTTTDNSSDTTTDNLTYTTTDNSSYTTTDNSSDTTTDNSSYDTTENSSYATRLQFITLIIITLNVLTHLQ